MATAKKVQDVDIADMAEAEALEDAQYQQYVRDLIEARLKSVDAGEVVSHEEVKKRLAKWRNR